MSSPCEKLTKRAHSDSCSGNKMSKTVTIQLENPTTSVKILSDFSADAAAFSGETEVNSSATAKQIKSMQDLETQKAAFSQACQTLKGVTDKLNEFYDKVSAEAKGEIAKLSVEIARKILVQEVKKGDYEIESIVKEALKNAPTRQDVVVHLNPEDLVQCQKAQQDDSTGTLAGIKFVSDPNIGRAECLLESPKGRIESLIEQHLEQIGKALENSG